MSENLKLFEFFWDCGRGGCLQGAFAATQEQVDRVMGHEVYFGEVLGKHSEVRGILEPEDLQVLTEDADFIAKAIEYGLLPIGWNPLDHAGERCDWCGERSLELKETEKGELCPFCISGVND